MQKAIVLALILIFLFTARAFAETSIKAEVNRTKLTTDEALTYKLTIAYSARGIPEPELPKFAGFYIISQTQSSSISFFKRGSKATLVYAFILSPLDTGKFKIEPGSVTIEGKIYSSEAFEIEVTQGKTRTGTKPVLPPSRPEKSLPESEEPQYTL